jgi:hypothetical protein
MRRDACRAGLGSGAAVQDHDHWIIPDAGSSPLPRVVSQPIADLHHHRHDQEAPAHYPHGDGTPDRYMAESFVPSAVGVQSPRKNAAVSGVAAIETVGPAAFALSVKAEEGRVGAEISSDLQPGQAITDVSKSDTSLILKYQLDYQGMAVPVVVTLKPAADTVSVHLDFADGAYQMVGTAARNKPAVVK